MSTFGSKAVHWITKSLLAALAYALLSPTVPAQEPSNSGAPNAEVRLPNILFILIDDLGWMDLACQGNKLVETPNIDRLALQGMRFTNAYAAAPVCSPTRAAIMTGKAPARLRITNHIPDRPQFTPPNAKLDPAEMFDRLSLKETTLAERLQEAGYATGFFGKWHLAGRGDSSFYPEHQGFDLNVGGCAFGGPPTFFDPYRIPTIKDRREGEYLPDRLADETIAFVRRHHEKPFAAFLWNYTVHWPMEAPEPLLKKYADRKGPGLNDTRYGAMIEAMDASIGKVLAELARLNLADDTLVIFTSDNGGFAGVSDNRPLRAAKGHLYEGGIRVPLIARWPGKIAKAITCDTPVISMDFYPTLLEAARLKKHDSESPDGVSLMPLLKGDGSLARDAIYFHYPNYAWHRSNRLGSAIRAGRYKLIERFDDGSLELYDLQADPSERRNLSEEMPAVAIRLRDKLVEWRAETQAAMPLERKVN
jgi:arylsulfatase A-like enzyme